MRTRRRHARGRLSQRQIRSVRGDGLRLRRMIRSVYCILIRVSLAKCEALEMLPGVRNGRNIEARFQWSTRFRFRMVGGFARAGRPKSAAQRGLTAFGSDYGWRLEPVGLQRT